MIEIFQVVPNVWCLRRASYLTCSYLVRSPKGYVFIDASMDSRGNDVKEAMQQLQILPEQIVAAFITHWHNDHSSGAAYLEDNTNSIIFCHKNEGAKLTQMNTFTLGARMSEKVPEAGPLVLLKGLLKDGPAIHIKNYTPVEDSKVYFDQFQVLFTPGHTSGHISIFDQTNKVLFAGDSLAVVKDQLRPMARVVTEDLAEGLSSMIRMTEVPAETICPGHRYPLKNCGEQMNLFRKSLKKDFRWPLLG